jgi:fatty acid desaturase
MIDRTTVRAFILVTLTVFLIGYYYLIDPTTSFAMPCLLHLTTGWNCWGCGGQRAFHQLLHGNFHQALQLNALIYPVCALLAFVLYSELTQCHPQYPLLRKRIAGLAAIAILLGFTILRNIHL